MNCPNCNNNIPDGSKFCNHCGQRIEIISGVKHCSNPQCGKEIPSDSMFCPFCGAKLDYASQNGVFLQSKLSFEVNGVSFNMMRVNRGSFMMGSTEETCDERPVHEVTITKDYYIGETQVTQKLWESVMRNNPSCCIGDDLPVETVSWEDCQDFIKKLNDITGKNFRLPTEAEWEFAARGGTKSNGYRYSGSDKIDDVAWHCNNSEFRTHPVMTKKSNELGIYDMSGNVLEWCQDFYGFYADYKLTNPKGPDCGNCHVIRGGSVITHASHSTPSRRKPMNPVARLFDIGLRLVLPQ